MLVRQIHQVCGISKLRFTGGEPLLRRDLAELIAACAKLGIADLALTTNAQLLAGQAEALKNAGLRRINISLDSLESATFKALSQGGSLAKSMAGIKAALENGLQPVKLNMVVMRGSNEHEIANMLAFGIKTGCQVRFLELMPIGMDSGKFDDWFVSWQEIRDLLESRFCLTPLPFESGATSRNYVAKDRHGRSTVCGFISPTSHPFCADCSRFRLTADGHLLGCLARRERFNLIQPCSNAEGGDAEPLRKIIRQALASKQQVQRFREQQTMMAIGG